MAICPGCGLKLESPTVELDEKYYASVECVILLYELSFYTLSLQTEDFIHQLVVDTYAAQHVGPNSKPITVFFALIGLYLTFENGYTGKQVQGVHMLLANTRRNWPSFTKPSVNATVTILDVVLALPSVSRTRKIREWGQAVWRIWEPEHKRIAEAARSYL